MAIKISGDSLEQEKRGRLLKDHQYEAVARARTAMLLNGRGGASPRGRASAGGAAGARSASGRSRAGQAKAPSRESVLKIINWSKAASSAGKQARYIARVREDDRKGDVEPLAMENERGEAFVGRLAVDEEMATWELVRDKDNLSPAALKADPAQRKDMKLQERLRRNQTVHMIFSIPSRSTSDPEKLRAAVRAGLAETFGQAGHRYVFTIHTEHSDKPHAHIIVKVDSEAERGQKSRALKIRPAEIHAIRHALTMQAQAQGIDVIATRREDRPELRSEILAGAEPLRADKSWHQLKQTAQGQTFEKSAPDWYKTNGADYERRRAEATAAPAPAKPTPGQVAEKPQKKGVGILARILRRPEKGAPDSANADPAKSGTKGKGYYGNFANVRAGENPAMAQLAERFSRSHEDGTAARASFLALYREAPKLALWAAHNHPETFGRPTGAKAAPIPTTLLKELPKDARPSQAAWSAEQDRTQRDEIQSLRRATTRARSEQSAEKNAASIRRSIERAADFGEKAIKHDKTAAKETAAEIRELAKSIAAVKPSPAGSPAAPDKAAQYQELEERLRRQDRAKGHNRDGGGRDKE